MAKKDVTGIVDDIEVITEDGRRGEYTKYELEIDGDKYSGFYDNNDELDSFFDEVEEGDEVTLELKKSGKYWNITDGEIDEKGEGKPKKKKSKGKKGKEKKGKKSGGTRRESKGGRGGNGGGKFTDEDKRRVTYLSAVSTASVVVGEAVRAEAFKLGSKQAMKMDNFLNEVDEVAHRIVAKAFEVGEDEDYVTNYDPETKDTGGESDD